MTVTVFKWEKEYTYKGLSRNLSGSDDQEVRIRVLDVVRDP